MRTGRSSPCATKSPSPNAFDVDGANRDNGYPADTPALFHRRGYTYAASQFLRSVRAAAGGANADLFVTLIIRDARTELPARSPVTSRRHPAPDQTLADLVLSVRVPMRGACKLALIDGTIPSEVATHRAGSAVAVLPDNEASCRSRSHH